IYDNSLLTTERLHFIIRKCTSYLYVSISLMKKLINDNNTELLLFILKHLSFFDNELVLKLLLLYRNKTPISDIDLIQQISNEKYKIINKNYKNPFFHINNCLVRVCRNGNFYAMRYLIKLGANINQETKDGKAPIISAC
ncbi:hypothetical protein U3516DRAFT_500399, partial [Neocallimastix sp. 'constans']